MPVDLRNAQSKKLPIKQLNVFSEAVLKELKLAGHQVNIVFVANSEIQKHNKHYLNHDGPTDVLAFQLKDRFKGEEYPFLGDVMISIDMAEAQAQRFKTSVLDELKLYIVHGILHLNGYRDEPESEKVAMEMKEKEILNKVRSRGH